MLKNRSLHDFEIELEIQVVDEQKNDEEYVPDRKAGQHGSENPHLSPGGMPPDQKLQHEEKASRSQRNRAQENEIPHRALFLHRIKIF